MNKPISTKVHGILDYVTAPTLLALPRVLGWNKTMTNLLSGAGLGVLGYSVMTRYELGIFKLLPMKGHLALDIMSGAALAASPLLLTRKSDMNGAMLGTLVGIGLYEIAAGLLTQTQPQEPLANTNPVSQLRELVSSKS